MRPAVLAIVSALHSSEPLMLRGQWRVHMPPCPLAHRLELSRQAFPFRLVLHDKPAISGLPTVVDEA